MGARLVVRTLDAEGSKTEYVFEFDQQRIVLGRASQADVRLPHAAVSEHHATIQVQGSGYVLVDEDSMNGTFLADARVVPRRPKPLRAQESLRIGPFEIEFAGGVPVANRTSLERTASLARQMLRGLLRPSLATPRLVVLHGPDQGRAFDLPSHAAELSIGRGAECDCVLTDGEVSRVAAGLHVDADGVLLTDRESKNSVLVNGKPATGRRLHDRDEIQVGASILVFEDAADPALKALEKQPVEPHEGPVPAENPALPEPKAEVATPAQRPARGGRAPELLIYTLAALVLAASAAGLLLLLRAE